MAANHFDDGWNAALAGLWSPPLQEGREAKLDYKEGWRQGQAELFLLLITHNQKPKSL